MAREYMSRHHLTPRERGGKNRVSNLCRLWWSKHSSLHKLFQNRTLDEIIAHLCFLVKQCEVTCQPVEQIPVRCNGHAIHWETVFGDHTVPEAIRVLSRLKRFKDRYDIDEAERADALPLTRRSRKWRKRYRHR